MQTEDQLHDIYYFEQDTLLIQKKRAHKNSSFPSLVLNKIRGSLALQKQVIRLKLKKQ